MRVLMFGWELPPHISGGLGTACLGLTRPMAEMGVDVTFVLPRLLGAERSTAGDHFRIVDAAETDVTASADMTAEFLELMGLSLRTIDSPLQAYQSAESYQQHLAWLRRAGGNPVERYGQDLPAEVARFALVMDELIQQETFDLLHAHDWMTFPAALRARRLSGKPLVCHVHATEYDRCLDDPDPRITAIEGHALREADRVLAVSHRTREMVCRYYDVDPACVDVVHNAVDKGRRPQPYWPPRPMDQPLVLFLGRMTVQKGPDYFLEAARLVLDELPEAHFAMAGAGDLFPYIVGRVASLRLHDRIHLTGFLKGADVERIYAMSDVYVMPSISEPFGITPFEASLHHVPVIISRQSGVAETLTQALKVDFWDVHQMAEYIIRLLQDPAYAAETAARVAGELDRINWENAVHKVISHYEALTGLSCDRDGRAP